MKRLDHWFARAKARKRSLAPWSHQRTGLRSSVVGGVVVILGALGTASVSNVLLQIEGAASKTELSSSANPSVVGQAITFKATVKDDPDDGDAGLGVPSGTVDFLQGGTTICDDVLLNASAEATCDRPYASSGNRTITATYSGDPNFGESTSPELIQTVNRAKTSTALSDSDADNKTVSGQSVTYTAHVDVLAPGSGTPTGTVAFKDGSNTVSGCEAKALSADTATCVTRFPVGSGSHAVTATYLGNANYLTSDSSAITQTVTPALTQTTLTSSKNPAFSTDTVTYAAKVAVVAPGSGVPTGRVVFMDGGSPISACSGSDGRPLNSSGVARCGVDNSRVGTHTITARYLGNSDFKESASNPISQVFKYKLEAWISSGPSSDPNNASFRISGKPARNYQLCVKYDDVWPARTPPPVNGATRYSLNLNYKCKSVSWSRGLANTRSLASAFGFATKGTYRAAWSVNGAQLGTDTFNWNTWCPPKSLRNIGVWRPSRHKTIDSCRMSSGYVARAGRVSGLDLDFHWSWLSGLGQVHVEYVPRDWYYSNPTTGSRNLLPNPGAAGKSNEWRLVFKHVCDTFHGYDEAHAVFMAQKGDDIYITGPQYNTKTPSVSGKWSAHTC